MYKSLCRSSLLSSQTLSHKSLCTKNDSGPFSCLPPLAFPQKHTRQDKCLVSRNNFWNSKTRQLRNNVSVQTSAFSTNNKTGCHRFHVCWEDVVLKIIVFRKPECLNACAVPKSSPPWSKSVRLRRSVRTSTRINTSLLDESIFLIFTPL
jgi:hypothetical protein